MAPKKKPAPKAAKKSAKPKRAGGRPCTYEPAFADQARRLCLLHHDTTDEHIAEFLGKHIDTIYDWKKKFPEFSEAIRAGKAAADADIAESLFKRAKGAIVIEDVAFKLKTIEYDEVTGKKVREFEEIEVVTVRKENPPDTQACSLWLRNRQRKHWAEKPEPSENDEYVAPVKVDVNVSDARKPEHAVA